MENPVKIGDLGGIPISGKHHMVNPIMSHPINQPSGVQFKLSQVSVYPIQQHYWGWSMIRLTTLAAYMDTTTNRKTSTTTVKVTNNSTCFQRIRKPHGSVPKKLTGDCYPQFVASKKWGV